MTEDELEQIRNDYDGVCEYDSVPMLLAEVDRLRAVLADLQKIVFEDASTSHDHRMKKVIHVLLAADPAYSGESVYPEGLCGDREDHEPHVHDSVGLGTVFWCSADQTKRLPFAMEKRNR